MNVRLLAGKIEKGVIHIYPLLCMDCEGDVFTWLDSYQGMDARTDEWHSYSAFRCVHCRREVRLADATYQMEATDDRDGWLARRHVHEVGGEKINDPSIERAKSSSTPSGKVR